MRNNLGLRRYLYSCAPCTPERIGTLHPAEMRAVNRSRRHSSKSLFACQHRLHNSSRPLDCHRNTSPVDKVQLQSLQSVAANCTASLHGKHVADCLARMLALATAFEVRCSQKSS